jgi:hypothetical protein
LSDDAQRDFRQVQEHFRLPSVGLVEKDLYVVKAIAALAAIDAAPFTLVFGGGTALARAHKLVRRMYVNRSATAPARRRVKGAGGGS